MSFLKYDIKTILLQRLPFISKYRFGVVNLYKRSLWFLRYLPGSSRHFGPPRGIYANAEVYNQANPALPIDEIVLKAEVAHTRKLPVSNSRLVMEKFGRYVNVTIIAKHAYILKKARYVFNAEGTVITAGDKIFLPASPLKNEWNYKRHQALYKFKLPAVISFDKVILIHTRAADHNYGHWLHDHLPRFFWLRQLGLDLSQYTLISTTGNAAYNKYSHQALKKAGYNFKEWLAVADVKHIYANELVVPPYTTIGLNGDQFSYDAAEAGFLSEVFLDPENAGPTPLYDKIYLSRRRSVRSSPQETELVDQLAACGVQEVFLEELNMGQQAILFNNASVIIGYHGAGFTNIFHCKPGATIIEIFSPDFIVTNFWGITDMLNINYYAYCNDEYLQNVTIYRLARLVPTLINIDEFMLFVKQLGVLKAVKNA